MSFAQLTVRDFLAHTAAKQPTPGGGAIAGVCGALAAALGQMVVSYSLGKKNLAQHQPLLEDAAKRLERARAMLLELADEDAIAYGLVNELSKLPENDARRIKELPAAQEASVRVPMAVGATGVDVLRLLRELCGKTNAYLRSDLAIAAVLAEATTRSAHWNVLINAPSLSDASRRETVMRESVAMVSSASRLANEIESKCR
ncbi:MAG: cyclodeaminase/cyclohydrolase family protein [Phycisphaerales bacterium]